MTIRYIMGRAGAGVDQRAIEEIGTALKQGGEKRLFLLVPEQYTLQAERNLIEQLQLPGIMQVEVLSFNRLAYRVLAEVGGRNRVLINEQGRNMVLKRVINEVARNLTIYKKACKQEGFVEELSTLFSNFKQYDLDPITLNSRQMEIKEAVVRQKLQDINLIYEAFNGYMSNQYLDLEDQLNLFIEKLDHSVLLKDARIWLDGFNHFPPQKRRMIEKIMLQAQDTTFCLTLDPQPGRDRDLFKISKGCHEQIHELASRHGLAEEVIRLDPEKRGQKNRPHASLMHLEQELYAYPNRSYPTDSDAIDLFAASNIYSEVEHIAARIVRMAQEQGYRWREISVLGNNLDTYGVILSRVFYEFEIPFFIDEKRSIDNHPLIKLILATLGVINRGYRAEDIFMLLKSGFTDLKPEECEELENYMMAYGIRGKLCQEDFVRGQHELDVALLETINQSRQRLILPLQKLEKAVQGKKSGRALSRALYQYLQGLEVEQKLQDWTEELRQQGLYEYAHENAQIWNIIMQTFDQLVNILGDSELKLKDYASLLETGYKSFQVGIIPTTVDQVMIGNISRSKNQSIKALFVMGVNDGVLPSGKSAAEIFTEEEQKVLQMHQLDWGTNLEMQTVEEQFDIYLAFSQAREFLSLSYAIADQEGKALRPSLLINRVRTIFPSLSTHSDLIKTPEFELKQLVNASSSFKYMIEKLRLYVDGTEIADFWWDVYGWFYNHPDWEARRQAILEALFYQNQIPSLSPTVAVQLYKTPFRSSVSRLEQFAACPFAHFVRFGLRPQERKSFAVGIPDIGILLHEGLATFASTLGERGINWKKMERVDCDVLLDEILAKQFPIHNNGILMSSYRYRYLAERLKRISRRAVWTLTEHIQEGDFEPLLYEARFGPGGVFPPLRVDLSDGQSIYLEGRIDRIDLLKSEDANYVKIIDYKSGDRQLSLSELYFGLSLQLFVYLLAVLKSNNSGSVPELLAKPFKPAALFYFKIDDPLVSGMNMDPPEIASEIRKKLRMNGLVLKDIALVRTMDRDLQGESDILPVGIKNNDEFKATSKVLEATEFELLFDYLQDLLKELGEQMLHGQIRIEPAKTDKWKACDYCIYHAVCQFDKLFAANNYKKITLSKDADVLQQIRKLQEDRRHE